MFLSVHSRLPTDVTFLVQSVSIPAHKPLLATGLTAFDCMFYGPESDPNLTHVDIEAVSPESFLLFLHHVYGKTIHMELVKFQTLAELYWLAVNYQDDSLRNNLVSRMKNMVENLTEYHILTEFQELIVRFNVEELRERLVEMIKTVCVDEENVNVLFSLAEGDDALSEAARCSLAKFLGRQCPFTKNLAGFLSNRPRLQSHTLITVLRKIGEIVDKKVEDDQNVKDDCMGLKENEVGVETEVGRTRRIVEDFLRFTLFPKEKRQEMTELYIKTNIRNNQVESNSTIDVIHVNVSSNFDTGANVSLKERKNIFNQTVQNIPDKIKLLDDTSGIHQVLDLKQSLKKHEVEEISTEVCEIETKESELGEGDLIPSDISLNKEESIDSSSKLTETKRNSLIVSYWRPPTSTTSARRLLQWALGTEYSVPPPSHQEERRLKEAIQKKEERRRRRKLEVEERG